LYRATGTTPAGDLLYEPFEDIVDDMFEIGEKAINRVSGWRYVESAVVPDQAVVMFSCNRTCTVSILIVAVEKAAKEVWWLVFAPRSGGEHVVLQQKFELNFSRCRIDIIATRTVKRSRLLDDFENYLTSNSDCPE
jgi:hypothetical protein